MLLKELYPILEPESAVRVISCKGDFGAHFEPEEGATISTLAEFSSIGDLENTHAYDRCIIRTIDFDAPHSMVVAVERNPEIQIKNLYDNIEVYKAQLKLLSVEELDEEYEDVMEMAGTCAEEARDNPTVELGCECLEMANLLAAFADFKEKAKEQAHSLQAEAMQLLQKAIH